MASTVAVLLLLSAGLFAVTVGFVNDNDCVSYITSNHKYMPSIRCNDGIFQHHCCGTCDNRYCCFIESMKLSTDEQFACDVQNSDVLMIVPVVIGLLIICSVFIIICCCCCCPCCCMYKMCRKPRPVVGTHITTVMNTQCIQQQQQQQPAMQPAQYPAYQPVPTQPGYGAQPMQTGPYQGQPYAPGPPPPYHIAANTGYPSVQAPYDGSQAMYPMMPPAQPGSAYPPQESFDQPAYNPAYMHPQKSGY